MKHRTVNIEVMPSAVRVKVEIPVIWPKDDKQIMDAFEETVPVVENRTKVMWFDGAPYLVAHHVNTAGIPRIGDFTSLVARWDAFLAGLAHGISIQIGGNPS